MGAPQFAVQPVALDSFKITGAYNVTTDSIVLDDFHMQAAGARFALTAKASEIRSGGPVVLSGTASPMPVSFLKAVWPVFMFNRTREWVGLNVPSAQINSGSLFVNLSAADVAQLNKGGDIPDTAASIELGISGAQIYHIKGLPPIITKDSVMRMNARRFVYDIPGDTRIEVPSGRSISFSDGQFLVENFRPDFPDAEVHFKSVSDVTGVLELLDQPPFNYVKAVDFKPTLINGQVQTAFQVKFPTVPDLQFKQMAISGKCRVSDLKSNGLPAGLAVNGGALNFDISDNAISAAGEVKVNSVPILLAPRRAYGRGAGQLAGSQPRADRQIAGCENRRRSRKIVTRCVGRLLRANPIARLAVPGKVRLHTDVTAAVRRVEVQPTIVLQPARKEKRIEVENRPYRPEAEPRNMSARVSQIGGPHQ